MSERKKYLKCELQNHL